MRPPPREQDEPVTEAGRLDFGKAAAGDAVAGTPVWPPSMVRAIQALAMRDCASVTLGPGRTMKVIRSFLSVELAEYGPVIPASLMQACMVS